MLAGPTFVSPNASFFFPSLLPRSRLIIAFSESSQTFAKSRLNATKSPMSPLTIAQIRVLPHAITTSNPSISRGIYVHPTKISSSFHRRQHLRSLAARPPAVVGRRILGAATAAGVVSCLFGSSAKASTPSEEFVKKTVSSGDVVVFSKSYCPYCSAVKSVLKEMNKDFSVIELDEREDGQDIQDALARLVGRRTVPQVFIKGEHLGGCDDTLEAYESGRLAKLLA